MTVDIGARWTARQLAMLRAMGIDFGARPRESDDAVAPAASVAGVAATPAATRPAQPSTAASRAATEAPPAPDRIARYMDDLATATVAPPQGDAAAAEAAAPAHWLVVSEPLPAGSPPARLLASMLRAVGLLPATGTAPAVAGPRRAALALFEPGADLAFDRARLMDAVLRAAPRCIVVFGRAPARVLLSTELPLAELRGRVHRLGETPVVVSYAIPYLLRQPADKARAWEDLCLATRACETTG